MLNKRPPNCTIFVLAFVLVSDLYVNVHSSFIHNAAAKSLQSCPTLCDPIDGSPPGSPVPGILQARTLQWVAISFCNAWKWKAKGKSLNRVRLFATPLTAAHQAPLSMEFSRQEYWSGLSFSKGSSQPRDQMYIFCITDRFFYCMNHQGTFK